MEPSTPTNTKHEMGLSLADDPRGAIVVRDVDVAGPAAGMLEPGDILIEVDGIAVRNAREAADAIQHRTDRPILLKIRRNGRTRFVAISP